jgi:hypothetical protein
MGPARGGVVSDGNDTETKQRLLAEIAALEEQLAQRESESAKVVPEIEAFGQRKATEGKAEEAAAPVLSAPMTRRESIVRWVAPVILSLPVVQAVGALILPGRAHAAADSDDLVDADLTSATPMVRAVPTATPTVAPTAVPTAAPTMAPTAAPTVAPTAAPTVAPTRAGRCVVGSTAAPPTATPSAAPTIGLASTPDARPIATGLVPLGSARGAFRGRIGQ